MSVNQPRPTDRITIERVYAATLEDVWSLWTTREGIESWWGPDGFVVAVRDLDLRAGGELRYAMTAVAADTVAFMRAQGMPITTEARLRYTEVVPRHRLAWLHAVDFIPGVAPYVVGSAIELSRTSAGVRLVMTLDRMHDDVWTQRAAMGWESELGKLGRVLVERSSAAGARP
jgi:uncharacterized protein YndB with AHSA1/START domain